jgi:hypothetical protein
MEMPKGQKPDDEVSISQKGADDKDYDTKLGLAVECCERRHFRQTRRVTFGGKSRAVSPKDDE